MKRYIPLTMFIVIVMSLGISSLALATNLNHPGSICKPVDNDRPLADVDSSATGVDSSADEIDSSAEEIDSFASDRFHDYPPTVFHNDSRRRIEVICPLIREYYSDCLKVILGANRTHCTLYSVSGLRDGRPYQVVHSLRPGELVPIEAPRDAVLSLKCTIAPHGSIYGIGVLPP